MTRTPTPYSELANHPSVKKGRRAMQALDRAITAANTATGRSLGLYSNGSPTFVCCDRLSAWHAQPSTGGDVDGGTPCKDGGAVVASISNNASWDGGDW